MLLFLMFCIFLLCFFTPNIMSYSIACGVIYATNRGNILRRVVQYHTSFQPGKLSNPSYITYSPGSDRMVTSMARPWTFIYVYLTYGIDPGILTVDLTLVFAQPPIPTSQNVWLFYLSAILPI